MKMLFRWSWGVGLALAAAATGQAEEPPLPPATTSVVRELTTTVPPLPLTMPVNERGEPLEGPPMTLFMPFEVYARVGASPVLNTGPLSEALRAGVGVQGGVRSFAFNRNRTAAWTASVGADYLYNNVDSGVPLKTIVGATTVTRSFFGQTQTLQLETVSTYAFRELHRTSGEIAIGREWYFGGATPESWSGYLGVDVGGRLGNVSVKQVTFSRTIEGAEEDDQFPANFQDHHQSDTLKGVLVGVGGGFMVPRSRFDWSIGTRVEWSQDWFRVADGDDGVRQLRLMLSLGVRF